MELNSELIQKLSEPFSSEQVSLKVQTKPNENGNALIVPYIDARDVIERLNSVVGGEWYDSYSAAPKGGVECALTVCGVTRRDVGDDSNDNEQEKTGYSDAFKRAAVKFGIGLFLYKLPKAWGQVRPAGKNSVIKDEAEEKRIRRVLFGGEKSSPPEQKKPVEGAKQQKVAQGKSDWATQYWGYASTNKIKKETADAVLKECGGDFQKALLKLNSTKT